MPKIVTSDSLETSVHLQCITPCQAAVGGDVVLNCNIRFVGNVRTFTVHYTLSGRSRWRCCSEFRHVCIATAVKCHTGLSLYPNCCVLAVKHTTVISWNERLLINSTSSCRKQSAQRDAPNRWAWSKQSHYSATRGGKRKIKIKYFWNRWGFMVNSGSTCWLLVSLCVF